MGDQRTYKIISATTLGTSGPIPLKADRPLLKSRLRDAPQAQRSAQNFIEDKILSAPSFAFR